LSDVEIDYDFLTQRALKRVVQDVLEITEELGAAPGDHHFYVEFETKAEGVCIPDHLIEAYPVRMTIVLQHQFQDLEVRDDEFAITLWFKGKQARLTVPYDAITSFADPSVQFGLRFDTSDTSSKSSTMTRSEKVAQPLPEAEPEAELLKVADGAAVVQLDAFRKK
jgi:hypothetical protein